MQTKISLQNIIRALRMPFILASILPFVFGSLIVSKHLNLAGFILGVFAVIATHLSANLINDYCDSKSGADWQDRRFFGFFGGSKLIQEGVFSEKFYLSAAFVLGVIALFCIIALAFLIKSFFLVAMYILIITLSWQYTALPLKFSYRYLGEVFIFLFFGPLTVMGGYFIQSGIFPDLKSFILSLPFGFFTTAILFSNEIPNFQDDSAASKLTWVNLFGLKQAYVSYAILIALGFSFIIFGVAIGYLSPLALLSVLLIPMPFKAAVILRKEYSDKTKLVQSSGLTIKLQALIGIVLILGVII